MGEVRVLLVKIKPASIGAASLNALTGAGSGGEGYADHRS